jgi:hypothetical protein
MPEEALKVHRFAVVLPEQLLSEAGGHRDAWCPPTNVPSCVALAMISPLSFTMFLMAE